MAELDPWLSERLAASELFVEAEQRVDAAMRELIEAWLAAVRRLVLGDDTVVAAGPPDLGGFAASQPEWDEAFRRIARPVLEDLFSERFLATARVATISAQPYRQAYIEEVFSRLALFPAEQFEEIRPEIEEAISEGEDILSIRSRIEAILDFDTAADAAGTAEHARSRELQARINQIERRIEQPGVTQDELGELHAERRRLYPELYASRRRWQWKAQRIARTETSGTLNGGAYWGAVANAEILGTALYHQWLSTDDERTRPTHVLADGQVRRLGRPFIVGGFPLRHPGDPLGPPHETIQCRCTALYVEGDELDDDVRRAADAEEGPDDTGVEVEPLDDADGAVDALTTTPEQAEADGEQLEGVDGEPVFVPRALLGELVPADLEPYGLDELLVVYPRFSGSDVDGSLRILERLDALEALDNAAASAAGDAAVADMVQAGDAAAAVEATRDAWGHLAEAWAGEDGENDVAPPWAPGTAPEPRGEGPGFRYDPDIDDTVEDGDVPAGWVLYEDPYTGEATYYEAAGLPKPLSRARRLADAKAAYADWVHQQFLDAEEVTRGNLFSRKGKKAGVSERALWSSNAVSARAWASEELLRYWQDHPRMTQVEWLYADTGDDRYRLAAQRARENNAKVLGAFSLVVDSVEARGGILSVKAERVAGALVAAAGRTGYARAELAGAWVAGLRAGEAGLDALACPYRPRGEGLLALLWVRAWRTRDPQTIIASGETIMGDVPNGWRGVLAALNVPTGDNRVLAVPEGGVRLRTPPLALLWQRNLAAGHDGAVVVGRIDRAWMSKIDGVEVIMGEGPLDVGGEDGAEAARQLGEGLFNGVSIDPDEVTFTEEFRDAAGNVVDVEALDIDEFYDMWDAGEITAYMIMTDWRLMGATLTPQPAFNEARVEPVVDYVPAGPQDGDLESVVAAAGEQYEPLAGPLLGRVIQPVPAAHYADPELTRLTPLTVTDDGRVFGHIAAWGACHIGYGDTCIAPPKSLTAYAHFHLGEVATDAGRLAAGKLTLGGGHADPKLGYRAAIEHYDNVATAVAGVRAGEDEFGIWVAGRVLAGVDAPTIERFLLCPPSGDWRRIAGNLELVAACAVNTAGFPVPRTLAASAAGIQGSLIAAGAAPLVRARRRLDRSRNGGPVDVPRLARQIAREVRAFDQRSARADQLAARIGRDPSSRAARAMTRLDDNRG